MSDLSRILHEIGSGEATTKTAFISGSIAFIGVVLSTIITMIVSGRNLYVNTVTTERSKWIDKLRQNLASCSGKMRTLSFRSSNGGLTSKEKEEAVRDINDLISSISLQLNPLGVVDQKILQLLKELPSLAEKQDGERFREKDDLLIRHSQYLFKEEWEKVKYEPRSLLPRLWGALRSYWRMRQYMKSFPSA